ncbi:MAG TPA: hypothetical protein VEP47_18720 [Reyranella sp.]|nr:hypothetical protein [Reyranella sp.]
MVDLWSCCESADRRLACAARAHQCRTAQPSDQQFLAKPAV